MLQEKLNSLLTEIHASSRIPGIVAAISIGGEKFSAAVGKADMTTGIPLSKNTRFQLGCITKLLTSLLALKISQEGKLDINSPITDYLSDLPTRPQRDPILVRHLAAHTSGYQGVNLANPGISYYYSWDKFLDFMSRAPQIFTPGCVFNYEHTESVMLGEILKRVMGQQSDQLMLEMLLAPLGILPGTVQGDSANPLLDAADHGFDASHGSYRRQRSVPYGQFWHSSLSGLTASVFDLLTLGEALIGIHHTDVFSFASFEKLCRPQIRLPQVSGGANIEQIPRAFGFGCAEYQSGIFGHNGSGRGQTCGFRFDPKRHIVLVVALNAWQPNVRDFALGRVLQAIGSKDIDDGKNSMQFEPSFLGTYAGGIHGTEITLSMENGYLAWDICTHNPVSRHRITALPENGRLKFQGNAGHLAVGFFRDPTDDTPCLQLGLNAYKMN